MCTESVIRAMAYYRVIWLEVIMNSIKFEWKWNSILIWKANADWWLQHIFTSYKLWIRDIFHISCQPNKNQKCCLHECCKFCFNAFSCLIITQHIQKTYRITTLAGTLAYAHFLILPCLSSATNSNPKIKHTNRFDKFAFHARNTIYFAVFNLKKCQ